MPDDWLSLLRQEVARAGSIQKAADRVGVSRAAVSLALAGRYPASTRKLSAKVLRALAGRMACPLQADGISPADCAARRDQPMPMSRPAELRAWTTCQNCPNRPKEA